MKNRYFIQLSYKGTRYSGWQIQHGTSTVQEVLDSALSVLLKEDIRTTGAGRTDTGVHALLFIAHFDTVNQIISNDFVYRINGILPKDIAVQKVYPVNSDAHSRFDARSRTYEYRISRTKDPFYDGFVYFFHQPLDVDAMNNSCHVLKDYNDFTSFSKLHSNAKTNICTIFHAKWYEKNDLLVFTIKADRFLRNMVRAIVGTMLEVGKGKLDIDGFRHVIEVKNRSAAGSSVPAEGLYLIDIEY